MGLGILEDEKLEHVPGTSLLSESGWATGHHNAIQERLTNQDVEGLKHQGDVILVPQPSDSPNDPLNWPRWKKEMFTIAYTYGTGCGGAVGPLITSALVPLAEENNVALAKFSYLTSGVFCISIGVSSIFCNSLAVKYGKRPLYLFSSILLFVSCFWAGSTRSVYSLTGARVLQGISL